jgi:hypothetical protein
MLFTGFSRECLAQQLRRAKRRGAIEKEIDMVVKILVAVGAVWSLGFFVFHFVRLLLGRRVF